MGRASWVDGWRGAQRLPVIKKGTLFNVTQRHHRQTRCERELLTYISQLRNSASSTGSAASLACAG